MVDASLVRDNFANMLDSQLIKVAEKEGHELSTEALNILTEEFKKRGLDSSSIETAQQNKILAYQGNIQKIKESSDDDFSAHIWKYILEEKQGGATDTQILNGLQERGMNEESALLLINGTTDKLKQLADAGNTQILLGAFIFFIGFFITLVTYTSAWSFGGYVYICWGAVLFGIIRILKGRSEKRKYKRILRIIEAKQQLKK